MSPQGLLTQLTRCMDAPAWWLGLSGGLDSMVLLELMSQARQLSGIPPLHAIHVHHGLHAEADAWAAHCQRACDARGVPLTVVRVQVEQGASIEEAARDAAQVAEWAPPTTLTAVLVPQAQLRPVLTAVSGATLALPEAPEVDEAGLLLVPDAHGRGRGALLRAVEGREAVVGPARPWLEVRASYDRVLRAHAAGLGPDTEAHLPALVLDADAEARADLRAQVLAPLADLRPAQAEKLTETLRAWLLHHGRREEVAAALFVHPQTVRYRMGQLRELYGDGLEDPESVLALTVALA